jgi:putative ABC transport system permease protein
VTFWPIAWYTMRHWLERFAYRIEIGAEPFLIAALMTIALALLSVGYQALRATRANPVETLRYE